MLTATDEIVLAAMASVALESKLLSMLTTKSLDAIESACKGSVYWPQFCVLVVTEQIAEDWLCGDYYLGKMVLYWAGWKPTGGQQ